MGFTRIFAIMGMISDFERGVLQMTSLSGMLIDFAMSSDRTSMFQLRELTLPSTALQNDALGRTFPPHFDRVSPVLLPGVAPPRSSPLLRPTVPQTLFAITHASSTLPLEQRPSHTFFRVHFEEHASDTRNNAVQVWYPRSSLRRRCFRK